MPAPNSPIAWDNTNTMGAPRQDYQLAQDEPSLLRLRELVRFGVQPDNAGLFSLWLTHESLALASDNATAWRQLEAQFGLLLEALLDELVPRHWRSQCLDHIYKPLAALHKRSDCHARQQRLQALLQELAITSRYIQHSL